MKKILIVASDMNVGGIQKALLELLKALATDNSYDVSLFCSHLTGPYLGRIPSSIKILSENKYALASESSMAQCKALGKKYFFTRAFYSFWSKFFSKKIPARLLCKQIGKIGEEYDVAISFSQPIEEHIFSKLTNEIVLHCVRAKKKATFVHCDFGAYGGNGKVNRRLYCKFDAIAAVSDSVKERFVEIVPEVAKKTYTVYNCCDKQEIVAMAATDAVRYERKAIVTVARLGKEKGLLRCISIVKELLAEGIDFEWHIVGGGPLENALKESIVQNGLDNHVFLRGEQANPYAFMKNADFFFLPSFHEAAPVVFDEAMALGIPILTTETLSAVEMIENQHAGIVCQNNDDAIKDMLRRSLKEPLDFGIDCGKKNKTCEQQFAMLCK